MEEEIVALKNWPVVAQGKEPLDGQIKTLEIENRTLSIGRVGERFYGIDDRCPHAGGRLDRGEMADESIVCPIHAWAFNVF